LNLILKKFCQANVYILIRQDFLGTQSYRRRRRWFLVSWPFHDSSTSSCAHNMEIRIQLNLTWLHNMHN